jgi:release factor glutamine methyltransferase
MILKTLLDQATERLEAAHVYSPRQDAEKIAAKILEIPREALKEEGERTLTEPELQAIESVLHRREKREPLARIFNGTEFCGLDLSLIPGVFEPLPESESLIEHAVAFLKEREGPQRVLDLCCGAGGLLLAILKETPHATGLGTDISQAAVQLAQINAEKNGLAARARFKPGDMAEGIDEKFDLVISNPPFIPSGLIPRLMPEVRLHDPLQSLNGGRDGMRFYRRLAHEFPRLVKSGGAGFFQLSYTMASIATHVLSSAGYEGTEICRNHYGVPVGVRIQEASLSQGLIPRLNRWRYGL